MKNIISTIESYMEKNDKLLQKQINSFMGDKKDNVNEASFRAEIAPLIKNIATENGIELIVNHEYSVYKGRIDTLYGRVNLEYKKPYTISDDNSNPKNIEYINEVKKQIEGLAKKEKIELSSILGIIFDGRYIIYVKFLNYDWSVSKPEERDINSLTKMFTRIYSLSMDKAVSLRNLVKDFGVESKITKSFIKTLYDKLTYYNNEKICILFDQWKSLFREVSGYSFDSKKLDLSELKATYGFKDKPVKIDFLIFSIHTYYAFLIKLLTIEIISHNKNVDFDFISDTSEASYDSLLEFLQKVENGAGFKELGISNFLEGDFFGWYLNLWDKEIFDCCNTVIKAFKEYDYETVHLDEDNSRDLLKNLYHYLLPKELRHALGEYYTPDWLAQFTYNNLEIEGNLEKTILDPCCGSGTFLVICINDLKKKNESIDKKFLLNNILNKVKGFDLNPLAVISARANYIITLGNLINETDSDIEIPVYLCDCMLTILEEKRQSNDLYVLATRAGIFEIPKLFVENGILSDILKVINNFIEMKVEFEILWNNLIEKYNSISGFIKLKNLTENLFNCILELKVKDLNNIWIQVIKNSFAPIFQKNVDYIIGNPPWINWQSLPEDYRNSINKYWHQYKIFDHKGMKARLGSAHDDLSVLLTYVVLDNYLKDKGKLGFVINQNLLQASGGGDGFRKLSIREEIPIKVLKVDDFVNVRPFEPYAKNKTAVIYLEKGNETLFPVCYKKWTKINKKTIDTDELYDSAIEKLKYDILTAIPIKYSEGITNSPWMISNETRINILKKLVGKSNYKARKGVDTSANGIYWLKIIANVRGKYQANNTPENSRKKIPEVNNFTIEKDLVFPLLRGKDISKWKYNIEYYIIIPYRDNFKDSYSIEELKSKFPLTYSYFYEGKHADEFLNILKSRGTYKKHYEDVSGKGVIPYHVLYNIGSYTKSRYKVLWKALQNEGMNSVVISDYNEKMIVPDHNNLMIPFDKKEDAYFLCAFLNSRIVGEFIDSYISWFKSAHILENIRIPDFDSTNLVHQRIVELSMFAHEKAMNGESTLVIENELEKLINEIL